MYTTTRYGEIFSQRDKGDTPPGTGMSAKAFDYVISQLPFLFAEVMKQIMEEDGILPANLAIRLQITAQGHRISRRTP